MESKNLPPAISNSSRDSCANLFAHAKGTWCDRLTAVLKDEWRNCKRAIEASSPLKDPKSILLPSNAFSSGGESSFAAAERMSEIVKVFVLQRQLLTFCSGECLSEQPSLNSPWSSPMDYSAKITDFDAFIPKPGSEINAENALPCRIAFERGKERHIGFLAISKGMSGWIILLEELPLEKRRGVVRVAAPLAGSDPRIDDNHAKWLHLRIRPSNLPILDSKLDPFGKSKTKVMVDGRWTLAFMDERTCKSAESMVIEELHLLQTRVKQSLKPLVENYHTMNNSSLKFSDEILEEPPSNTR